MNQVSKGWTSVAIAVATSFGLFGCTTVGPDEKPARQSGYTCCNIHYEKDLIDDRNLAQLPMIQAGAAIKILDQDKNSLRVDIEGKPYRLVQEFSKDAEPTGAWLNKLIVADDPKSKLLEYPSAVRAVIQKGQVMLGMTREQVQMALGYPLANENPRLQTEPWRYWWTTGEEYQVHWSGDRVAKVTGRSDIVALMLASGNADGSLGVTPVEPSFIPRDPPAYKKPSKRPAHAASSTAKSGKSAKASKAGKAHKAHKSAGKSHKAKGQASKKKAGKPQHHAKKHQ